MLFGELMSHVFLRHDVDQCLLRVDGLTFANILLRDDINKTCCYIRETDVQVYLECFCSVRCREIF